MKKQPKKNYTLLSHIGITNMNKTVIQNAIKNPKIHDFENGMEYYSAIASDCKVIVTNNKEDYYFTEIQVLEAENFLKVFC